MPRGRGAWSDARSGDPLLDYRPKLARPSSAPSFEQSAEGKAADLVMHSEPDHPWPARYGRDGILDGVVQRALLPPRGSARRLETRRRRRWAEHALARLIGPALAPRAGPDTLVLNPRGHDNRVAHEPERLGIRLTT